MLWYYYFPYLCSLIFALFVGSLLPSSESEKQKSKVFSSIAASFSFFFSTFTKMKSKNTQLQKSETSKLEATISMMEGGNPNKTAPTLGYFSSGFDPLAARMKYMGSGSSSNTIKFYRNTKYPKRFEAVIKPKGEGVGVDFVGTNYRGPGKNNFALGVLDKITGTLTVTDINTDKVLRLEPVVRASHNEPETPTPTPTPANNQNASAVQDDTRDRKNSLINLYGTKTAVTKAKRAMQLRRDEDYDGSKVEVMQAIENMSKSIDKEAIVSWSCNAVGTHSDIPPYDLSATLPEKAYLRDKIILKGEWAYVRDLLQINPPPPCLPKLCVQPILQIGIN